MRLHHCLTWTLLTTALAVVPAGLRADKPTASSPVVANHPIIKESLQRLAERSGVWRAALKELERLGRQAVVVTPKSVRVKDPQSGAIRPFDHGVLAEVQPLAGHETRVEAVVVVVNLELLYGLQRPLTPITDFEDDLDRILAHEIYGHAIPYLLAGDLSGKCADPVAGQRAEDACAIKRENEIRADLQLGQRRDIGVEGLTVARRYRD